VRRIDDSERRGRLVRRHRLTPAGKASGPVDVARAMVALHSTGAAAVYLAIWARTHEVRIEDVERALYSDRTLVRMLGMRRTVFVVPVELVPVIQGACTRAIARNERRKLEQLVEHGGLATDGAGWVRAAEEATLEALRARGEAAAAELSQDVPQLRERVHVGKGTRWEGVQGLSTRVLWVLAGDGRIVRGRPRGSWISSQYRWAPVESWLPAGVPELPTEEAQAELARHWLGVFGPAPAADLRWWAGWTVRDTTRALAAAGAVEVELDTGPGWALEDDLDSVPAPEPVAALLPALDSTVMGWTARDWFLGPHAPVLFDRSGNAGPTVWWDGRVVGAWGQRADGEVVYRLLEEVGAEARRAIDDEAARLQAWLGPHRAAPAFPTPLGRELVGDRGSAA
jgi:Winged helix DNA-binding domain